MGERLTWEEIRKLYPAQWVGLAETEFEEDGDNIKSGIVKYASLPSGEITIIALRSKGAIVARHTCPDCCNILGALGMGFID